MQEETYNIKFTIHGIQHDEQYAILEQALQGDGVMQIDINKQKHLVRVITHQLYEEAAIREQLIALGFSIADFSFKKIGDEQQIMDLRINGMTCRSCEVLIERSWKKIDGVHDVSVDATKGTARVHYRGQRPENHILQSVIADHGYQIMTGQGKEKVRHQTKKQKSQRPSIFRMIGLFAIVLLLGSIASKLGFIKSATALGDSVTLGAAFVLGLVAATSSCLAVSGGVLLSSVAQFQKYHPKATLGMRMVPVTLFVGGRVIAYGVLGGVIGLIGKSLSPSPFFTGLLTLLAALYMLFMGLDMLNLVPGWMKRIFLPRLPKKLSHAILDLEEKSHPLVPFALGAGTFFLPCGFT